jgi:hypothetical protein
MKDVEKRVSGDWIDIRELSRDYFTLKNYFRIPDGDIEIQIGKLKFAIEHGIVEYKRASLSPLFRTLENSRYQNPGMDVIEEQIRYNRALLFVTLIQRLFAEGTLKLAREKVKEEEISTGDLNLKDILQDINRRIREEPSFGKGQPVKKILMQVNIYKREQDTMKKLLPTIKPDSQKSFMANFKKTFAEIIDKIKRNYIAILKEEIPPDTENKNVLGQAPLKELLPILTSQAMSMSRICSTLLFIKEEKYKTREILDNLSKEKKSVVELLDREMEKYKSFGEKLGTIGGRAVSDPASVLSRFMSHEIIQFLGKEPAFKQTS